MAYIKIGTICAVYADCSLAYTAKPIVTIGRFNSEWIIDIPFCRIIFTPGKLLKRKQNKEHHKGECCGKKQKHSNLSERSERATEDSS